MHWANQEWWLWIVIYWLSVQSILIQLHSHLNDNAIINSTSMNKPHDHIQVYLAPITPRLKYNLNRHVQSTKTTHFHARTRKKTVKPTVICHKTPAKPKYAVMYKRNQFNAYQYCLEDERVCGQRCETRGDGCVARLWLGFCRMIVSSMRR